MSSTIIDRAKSLLGIDKTDDQAPESQPSQQPASSRRSSTRRRRERTPNQQDFNRVRAATVEVIHPTQAEPWVRERGKDGVEETYRRCLDENLPLGTFTSLLEEGQSFRVYFNSTKQEVELKPDGSLHKVTRDDHGVKLLEECGTWGVEPCDFEGIDIDTDYGQRNVRMGVVAYKGRRFASPSFVGMLHIQAKGLLDRKGETVDCDIRLPIYAAQQERIRRDRERFLDRLEKRDTLSQEFLTNKAIRQPFMNCHEAYLLRPNQLHDTGATRFDVRELS